LPNVRSIIHEGRLLTTSAMVHLLNLRNEAWCHLLVSTDTYDRPPRSERGFGGRKVAFRKAALKLRLETVPV
jgi:hypothetical protein